VISDSLVRANNKNDPYFISLLLTFFRVSRNLDLNLLRRIMATSPTYLRLGSYSPADESTRPRPFEKFPALQVRREAG
jgi:hypothetical protein